MKFLQILLSVSLCLWWHRGVAQDTLNLRYADLESLISRNLLLQNADLRIQAAQNAQKGSFSLPKTDIDVQYGNINMGKIIDFSAQVSQSFAFPSVYAAQKSVAQGQIGVAEKYKNLQTKELLKDVRKAYIQLLFLQNKEAILIKKDSFYTEVQSFMRLRENVGEIGAIENLQNTHRQHENKYQLITAQSEIETQKRLIAKFLNLSVLPSFVEEKLEKVISTSNASQENPFLAVLEEEKKVTTETIKLERRKTLPDIRLGVYAMSIENIGFFPVAQAGLSIPLALSSHKMRIQNAQLQEHISSNTLEYQKMQVQKELEMLSLYAESIQKMIENQQKNQLPTVDKILSLTQKRYQNNEIDYTEVINAQSQVWDIHLSYLETLKKYQDTQIEISFLSGN